MRTFFFLFCSAVFALSPNNGISQNAIIKIEETKQVSIDEVFSIIKNQTNYNFVYGSKLFEKAPSVELEKGAIRTYKLLDKCLAKTVFTYEFTEDEIIILKRKPSFVGTDLVELPQQTISGVFTDIDGGPIPGVNVMVGDEGSSKVRGVATDFDGKYTIDVVRGEVIRFSFLGYTTQTVTIADQSEINIVLLEDTASLGEVVITGYQTISRERATGSFVKVDYETLENGPIYNLVDQLEGMAAGVNVSTSGEVEIRGVGTMLAGSEPLYVVDGFPVSIPGNFNSVEGTLGALSTINPEDIESVTVLKDASAASIWGVRASNGVIVITTKKGRKNDKLTVDFSAYLTVEQKIDYSKQNMASASDVIDMQLEANEKGWFDYDGLISRREGLNLVQEAQVMVGGYAPDGSIWSQAQYNNFINDLRTRDANRQREENLLRQPLRQTYNLSISGGSEKNNFYASMVVNDNINHAIGDSDDRMILNIQDTYRLNEKFGFSAGVTATLRNNRVNGVDPQRAEWYSRPYDDLVNEYGQTIQYYNNWNRWESQNRESITGIPYSTNDLDTQRATDHTTSTFDVRAKFGLDWSILDNLKFTSGFQYEKGSYDVNDYETMDLPAQRILVNDMYNDATEEYQIPLGTTYRFQKESYKSWNFRNTLTWDQTWDNHKLNVFAGTEIIRRYSEFMSDKEYGFNQQTNTSVPVDQAALQGGTLYNWNGDRHYDSFYSKADSDDREFSVFSNVGYEFNDKYSLNASFRIDQKNLFGSDPDFRYKPLWSTGLGWNITKEDFMADVDWVNRLRLRTTYGLSGNANNRYSPYAQARNLLRSHGRLYDFLRLTQPANDKLKWEETTTFNIATDFSLFNNKLNGSIEYYKQWSNDLLGWRKLDVTNGFKEAVVNYASMVNSGIEIDLSYPILAKGDFKWNSAMNLSYNNNEVTEIEDQLQPPSDIVEEGLLAVGSPYNNIYTYDYAGLDEYGHPLINAGGTIKSWRDLQTEPLVQEDLIYAGKTVAPWYGGLRNTFSYKDFDLAVNITYKFGHYFSRHPDDVSFNGGNFDGAEYGYNVHESFANRWQQPGDENNTRIPALAYEGLNPLSGEFESKYDHLDADIYYRYSQDHVYKADFIRVRDIILGYNMPKDLMDKIFIENVRFTAQVQNPFLWTANSENYDPEAAYRMAYDNLTTFTFGVKATF